MLLPVLAYLGAFLAMAGVFGLLGDPKPTSPLGFLAAMVSQLAGAATCLLLASSRFNGGAAALLWGPEESRRLPLVAGLVVLVTLLAVGLCPLLLEGTVRAFHFFRPDHEFSPHSTIQMLHDESQPGFMIVGLWIGAVVVAPTAEELFFRGILQTVVWNATLRRGAAIAASSVAFALAHTQQPHAMPALIALAALLGFVYERTGALLPCILIHAVFNLKTLIWDALGGE